MMDWNTLLCEERRRPVKKGNSSTDNRSEFEKDYHRIIGSPSFRRLQDKTQVYPLDQSDFIRTRLTHSLEVSSIAKSLGQSVGNQLKEEGMITNEQALGMTDILLCSGLLHDIGNPPFGHFGETVIRDWFRRKLPDRELFGKKLTNLMDPVMCEDLYHFEGNAQSLRVVTRLHHLVDDNGMNLTKGLLNTIIKYPVSSTEINKNSGDIRTKKMGFFYGDRDVFYDITESTGAGNKRHPLVFLLESADDIAYSTADLEDGIKKGIISYSKLLYLLKKEKAKLNEQESRNNNLFYAIERLEKLYDRAMQNEEPDPELYAVQNWIVTLQSMMIRAVTSSFHKNYDLIMKGEYKEDLFYGTESETLAFTLKEIAFKHIFSCNGIVKLEIAADRIIGFLLDQFAGAAISYDTSVRMTEKEEKLIALISPNYKRVYQDAAAGKSEGEKLYLRMLLVTDYISGMTDHYAKTLYQELNGIY